MFNALVVTVRVEVPDPPPLRLMLFTLRAAVGPGGETVADRLTEPEKPPVPATEMVEVPWEPAAMVRLVVVAVMLKSGPGLTVTETVTVCVVPPEVPVTVTVKVTAGVEVVVAIFSVERPVPPEVKVTGVGLTETVGPVGETVADKLTEPANPTLASEMADVPEDPAVIVRLEGLAERLKSAVTARVISTS